MRSRRMRTAFATAGCLVFLLLTGCSEDLHPLTEVEVTGDPAVLARFQGSWYYYDYEQVLGVRVRGTAPGRLAIRTPPSYRIKNARTEGGGIRFLGSLDGETREFSLLLLADDTAFFDSPSDPGAGCGSRNPCLERLNAWGLVVYRAGALAEDAAQEVEEGIGWLADFW